MRFIQSVIAAFSCFSAIPMPHTTWDDDSMRHMMAAFPLVGAVIGVSVIGWANMCAALGFGSLLRATGFTLIPLIISGGIHMDGFADVMDAHASHADPDRRREILKDPHTGAFAILGVCCYLMAYLAFASEVERTHLMTLACVPVISRCLSGLATVTLRPAQQTGMYATERASADTRTVQVALTVTLAAVKRYADRAFGGMSGDLAGFFLQVVELVMVACIAFLGKLV